MRVLHYAETLQGGIASYLDEVADFQVRTLGASEVHFFVPPGFSGYVSGTASSTVRTFPRVDRSLRSLLRQLVEFRSAVKEVKPDVVHLHSTFAGLVGRLALLAAPQPKPKVVYCAHGWSFGMRSGRMRGEFYSLVERVLAFRADVIINISDFEHALAVRCGLPKARMKTIHNGISSHLPSSAKAQTEDVNLIFVGRHDRQKGLDIFLSALSRIRRSDIRVKVVGEAVVDGHGDAGVLTNNVEFLGWLPRHQVSQALGEADAIVMPSRWEGFGLVAIEAMRAGTAVIASNVGALPEIVLNDRTGYIFDIDAQNGLVDVIENLNRDELRVLGEAGRDRFLEKFTSDKMNSQLISTYREVSWS